MAQEDYQKFHTASEMPGNNCALAIRIWILCCASSSEIKFNEERLMGVPKGVAKKHSDAKKIFQRISPPRGCGGVGRKTWKIFSKFSKKFIFLLKFGQEYFLTGNVEYELL